MFVVSFQLILVLIFAIFKGIFYSNIETYKIFLKIIGGGGLG